MFEEMKDDVIRNCRLWLEDVEEIDHGSEPAPDSEEPDLYSFYEQLSVLGSEFRKNSRRTHETFSGFGESLDEFQDVLTSLSRRLDAISKEKDEADMSSRQELFLPMVELYERFRRIDDRLKEESGSAKQGQATHVSRLCLRDRIARIFSGKEKPRGTVRDSVAEGLSLALSHFEGFLTGNGIYRIAALGSVFDPFSMIAVGTVETATAEPDTVFEEIEGGYMYGDRVLKFAKVTVAKSLRSS